MESNVSQASGRGGWGQNYRKTDDSRNGDSRGGGYEGGRGGGGGGGGGCGRGYDSHHDGGRGGGYDGSRSGGGYDGSRSGGGSRGRGGGSGNWGHNGGRSGGDNRTGGNDGWRNEGSRGGYQNKSSLNEQWQPDHRENMQTNYKFSRVQLKEAPHPVVHQQLQLCYQRKRIAPTTTLDAFIDNSLNFWNEFPSETARLHVLRQSGVPEAKLEAFVHSVYPIVHHTTLPLMCDFLDHKRRCGSQPEKDLYKDMDLITFVDRLLKARPLSFLGANDQYLLPGPSYKHGYGGWEEVGTSREHPPLLLQNYLSYDEMRIAALISLSSWSVFVNNGRRKNYGKKDEPGSYQPEGVIVGQVGARLKKERVMDYLDCVVTPNENKPENGFGHENKQHVNHVWGKLWGGILPTHEEANSALLEQRDGTPKAGCRPFEYMPIGENLLFNVTVYKKRIAITAEILICEARSRAQAAGKKAYIHVVGLGLGVWRASKKQDALFVDAWGDALSNITDTSNIAYVDFSYINAWSIYGVKNGDLFPNTNITIKFSERNLHDKVPDDCILVCNYAWDGNSLPGNEFWLEKMCSTGDSAAACSSCVAEIHNHLINPVVGADVMRVATRDGRVVLWEDYISGNNSSANFNELGVAYPQLLRPLENRNSTYCPPAASATQPPAMDEVNGAGGKERQTPPRSTSCFDGIPAPPAHVDNVAPLQKSSSPSVTHSEAPRVSTDNPSKAEVVESVPEVEPPKQIRHPSIVGQMIDNPAYKVYVKKMKAMKKKEAAGASGESKSKKNANKEAAGGSGESKPKPGKNTNNAGKGGNQTKIQNAAKGNANSSASQKKTKSKK